MSDAAFLRAMLTVEEAWLAGLVDAGIAPADARTTLMDYLDAGDAEAIARRADVDGMAARVNENTVLVVGSAPQYPQGVIDPIPELAALASEVGARSEGSGVHSRG